MVKQYPERISEAMQQAIEELKNDWQQLQAKLTISAMKNVDTAGQIDQKLTQTQQLINGGLSNMERLLETERAAMAQAMTNEHSQVQQLMANERTAMADERTAMQQLMADERAAIAQQAQDLAEQQKQVLEKHTKDLIAQGVIANQRQAESQVKGIVNAARGKHYWEAGAIACLMAALLMSSSWLIGWVSRGRAENSSAWGDIERWNHDPLKACIDANKSTCNFHIKVPEE